MKLKQVGEKTYYIEAKTNIGIYVLKDNSVCIIDTGSEGDGQKIDEILMANHWKPEFILNTHTHIDHIGGNRYLMEKYNIPAFCSDYDMAFAHYSELEAAYMIGGYPCKRLRDVFAHPGKLGFKQVEEQPAKDIEVIQLPGHSFGMVGYKTKDDVCFLGDAYLDREFIDKFHFGFIYDVGQYIATLEKIESLKAKAFVPSHSIVEKDIKETILKNKINIEWMINLIKEICSEYIGIDDILKQIYERLNIRARITQHALLSSTIKSYLAYLQDKEEIECRFIDNIMMWKTN